MDKQNRVVMLSPQMDENNLAAEPGSPSMKSRKRKKTGSISSENSTNQATQGDQQHKEKTKKQRTGSLLIGKQKPLEPTDLILALSTYHGTSLSPVEKDLCKLEVANFTKCNDGSHTGNSYLQLVLPKWKRLMAEKTAPPGYPSLLIICPAALRATQLNRDITHFKGADCKTAKLFAKHIKLDQQSKFLSKSAIHLGIGTPNRILALLDCGALHLNQLMVVVIDWSWRDIKLRSMVDIPEVRADLFRLMTKHIIPHVKSSKSKIGLM